MKAEVFSSKKMMVKHEKSEPKSMRMMEKKSGMKPIVKKVVVIKKK